MPKMTTKGNLQNLSSSERTAWYASIKKQKRVKQKAESYRRIQKENKLKIEFEKRSKESRERKIRRDRQNEMIRKRKEYEKERKRKWRKMQNNKSVASDISLEEPHMFKHRMTKKRAVDRVKKALPKSPNKRHAVLKAYLSNEKSPTVTKILRESSKSPETPDQEVASLVLNNVKEIITENKLKRSKEKRTELHAVIASVSGENLAEITSKSKVAKRLGVSMKTLSRGQRLRTIIIKSDKSCWESAKRKGRSDGVTDEQKKSIYDFWISPEISRPTGNKKDILRHRIGTKKYLSHSIHLLEVTQIEAFNQFKQTEPDIKISQRTFEKYKPFFVKPVRVKDKCTCCCRYHVEFGHAFRRCMQLRTALLKTCSTDGQYQVYEHSGDLIETTMCGRVGNHFRMKCLNRECSECGVKSSLFMPEELNDAESAADVEWEKYEYKTIQGNGTQTKRKLVLVRKQTKIGTLFKHLMTLLQTFPAHSFRATWQQNQAKRLIDQLPLGEVVAVHDYAENYRCSERTEIQSSYFQKVEVSIHVTILYRHAILEYDGVESFPNEPKIVQEQFFVISPDTRHDHHFTYHAEKLLNEYLTGISYPLTAIHEYTDGCASQYKSRHCFGSLTTAASNFKCTITRNFHETSHAKGPQDAAGGFLKQQADLAVLRGRKIIQSAKDFFDYVSSELVNLKESAVCSQRLFRYVHEIPRNTVGLYRPIPSIRKIHQVRASQNSRNIVTRNLSCYSCDACFEGNFQICDHLTYSGVPSTISVEREQGTNDSLNTTSEDDDFNGTLTITEGNILAVRADNQDYFLFEARTNPYVLKSDKTDEYQTTYMAGTSVIEGRYFDIVKKSSLDYKLLTRHTAIVPTLSVIRVCSEVKGKRFKLPETVHQTIIDTLDDVL